VVSLTTRPPYSRGKNSIVSIEEEAVIIREWSEKARLSRHNSNSFIHALSAIHTPRYAVPLNTVVDKKE
jgi:hypothetical protein